MPRQSSARTPGAPKKVCPLPPRVFLNSEEAASYLGVSFAFFRRKIRPLLHVTTRELGDPRFDREEIDRVVRSNMVELAKRG